jgi:hypothetical protein
VTWTISVGRPDLAEELGRLETALHAVAALLEDFRSATAAGGGSMTVMACVGKLELADLGWRAGHLPEVISVGSCGVEAGIPAVRKGRLRIAGTLWTGMDGVVRRDQRLRIPGIPHQNARV